MLLEESERRARRGGTVPAVSIRVNPDVRAGGHPHISTGRLQAQVWFGLGAGAATLSGASGFEGDSVAGNQRAHRVADSCARAVCAGAAAFVGLCERVAAGGNRAAVSGFWGRARRPLHEREDILAKGHMRGWWRGSFDPCGCIFLLEPGRTIIGPAGVLLTRVLYVKENRGKTFVVVDSGMNDLLRPALYGAIHPITRVTRENENHSAEQEWTLSGPFVKRGIVFCGIGRLER